MKKVFLILLIGCKAATVLAQNEYRQTPFLVKPLANEVVKQVDVLTSGGNISVESVPAEQARVEVFIWPSGKNNGSGISKEEIQKRLDELYDFSITVSDNKFTAIAKSKKQNMNWKNTLSISFKIFVNKNIATQLTTSGGNIELKAITGEHKITTSGGNLSIDHVNGKLKGRTSGGNIEVKDSDEEIELVTSGGNIEASNCKGSIKLSTSGGDINLVNLDGNIDAATSGGDVRANDIRGELDASTSGGNINLTALACNLTTGTSGGDIKVAVKVPGKFIKIKNSGGKIELQLPQGKGYDFDLSADKIKADNLGVFKGKLGDDEIVGQSNGGGTEVKVNASSGKIILTFK